MGQFIVNEKGERTAIVLPLEEYERLREAAEETTRTRRFPGIGFRGPEHDRRA